MQKTSRWLHVVPRRSPRRLRLCRGLRCLIQRLRLRLNLPRRHHRHRQLSRVVRVADEDDGMKTRGLAEI